MIIRSATKRSQQMGTVCSESGQMVCGKEEVINRWKALLKGDTSVVQAVKRVEHSKVMHNDEEISLEEVYASIRGLKNRKSPGVCSITGEMLKLGGFVVVKWMHQIINLAWKNGSIPADWRRALIIPIHKKGSRLQCRNYRGISLLSIPGEVYASILDRRVRAITEDKLLE